MSLQLLLYGCTFLANHLANNFICVSSINFCAALTNWNDVTMQRHAYLCKLQAADTNCILISYAILYCMCAHGHEQLYNYL